MRGAIKALIMANEYLETEVQELQASDLGRPDADGIAENKGAA